MITIGVDVGGTFTDLVLRDGRTGAMRSLKTPSTPEDLARGVMTAIRQAEVPDADIAGITHGMTVATNTALEMNGARLGVITTEGHRDVLVVGRGNRTKLYDIKAVRPVPLVPRRRILEVTERLTASGAVHKPLDEKQVVAACKRLEAAKVEAIAICFLHAYANPAHELRAAEIVRAQLPGIPVSLSHEILPEYREFERFSTTALNAYVGPKVSGYLNTLSRNLTTSGIDAPLRIMGSNGGTWRAAAIAAEPVNSMLSGPAGGVTASIGVARLLGLPDIITYDMGGTSTDACLVRNYSHDMTTEGHVGMWPNRAPQIEIKTVGAGGGSIAYLDTGNFLQVGPRSAGALPGPACYGRGGTEPTVTDANVLLGRFRPDQAIGGEIAIDTAAAETAIGTLGETLSLSPARMAEGIVRIAVARMTGTVKEISVMRGLDPRDFTLFAYGGAGPLHAAAIADELGMTRIVIPPMPGAFSAYGLLAADTRYDVTQTRLTKLDNTDWATLQDILTPLRTRATERLAEDGFTGDKVRLQTSLEMRYVGQAFELATAVPDGAAKIADIENAFRAAYEERYGQLDEGPVEIVSFRVIGIGLSDRTDLPEQVVDGDLSDAEIGRRPVVFGGTAQETSIYRRPDLPTGIAIPGPAIIEEDGATTVVPPGFTASQDRYGIMMLTKAGVA
ncbi:MAG: hydantoinase/oxoprolinase family protein [Rhodospirillaceae bacterium]|nr:hydantoinase/oxoprolinase family protein [Rhodospirillaceae bacterium]MDD9928805.1 hydantoinase/oxoprolinase family protein [Rhodospirillaceae bacterium]